MYIIISHGAFKNFFSMFFILFLGQGETEHERGRGRERGRHRIVNRLQALSHQPRARHGARTHGPRNHDLAEVRRLTDCATQAPLDHTFISLLYGPLFASFWNPAPAQAPTLVCKETRL